MKKPRVVNKMPQFIAGRMIQAERVITQVLIYGASEASVLTPIDTSVLLNSQTREVKREGVKIAGKVIYTAGYAAPVHDPNRPQRFRRATAEKEFLAKGFSRNKKRIDAIVKKGMKV